MADEHAPPASVGQHEVEPPAANVAAVQVKLPPFWPKDPELWFAQIEAQFGTRGIRQSKTKFDYVVSCLSPEFATEVRDLLLRPPEENPYETLKDQLTKRTSDSEQRRIKELLSAEEIGDRKPTQVLRRIQQLLGGTVTIEDTLLRELFLQRLPPNVRMVLTPSASALNLNQLAELADRILEASPTPTVAATNCDGTTTTQLATQVAQLTERLDKLTSQMTKTINHLTRHRRQSRSRSPGGSYRRRSSSTSSTIEPDDGLCYYHRKFGDQATKCRPPCKRAGND